MRKKWLSALALILALVTVFALAVPVFADVAPSGATVNALHLDIGRPGGSYHVGGVIPYTVTVSVPLTVGGAATCLETNNNTTFTDPHGNVQTFPVITSLLPGESVAFTASGATYTVYAPTGSEPTRANLVNGSAAMPASPTYTSDTSTYAGTYALLNYTIASGDLVLNGTTHQVTASAHTGNTAGAHDVPNPSTDNASADTTITTQVSSPDTLVTIGAASPSVASGQSTTLTVTEQNTGDVPLTSPSVVVLENGGAFMTLVAPPSSGDTSDPGVLDSGETWTWNGISTGALTSTTNFQATGHGFDNSSPPVDITFPNHEGEQASTSVTVNSPSTLAQIGASPSTLPVGGGTVTLTVSEFNNGSVDLSNVVMTVTNSVNPTTYTLMKTGSTAPAIFTGGDVNSDGILNTGETWTWSIPGVPVTSNTDFIVNGDGTYGSPPVHVNFTNGAFSERNDVTVGVQPPHQFPASSNLSLGLLIAGFAGVMVFLGYRRVRRSQI
jgi:hypothetical protein